MEHPSLKRIERNTMNPISRNRISLIWMGTETKQCYGPYQQDWHIQFMKKKQQTHSRFSLHFGSCLLKTNIESYKSMTMSAAILCPVCPFVKECKRWLLGLYFICIWHSAKFLVFYAVSLFLFWRKQKEKKKKEFLHLLTGLIKARRQFFLKICIFRKLWSPSLWSE